MQRHTFNTAFVRQFCQESILYPWEGKQRYGNIRFHQFAGRREEASSLGMLMAKKMNYTAVVAGLIGKLKNEDIPGTRKLFELAHRLLREFGSCKEEEFCTSAYYDKLLAVLKPFLALIKIYQSNMQLPLLQTLTSFLTEEVEVENFPVLSSEDLTAVRELMVRFQDELYGYYEVFDIFIRQESDNKSYVGVTSKVEHYMLKLMTMIEKAAINTQCMVSRIGEWNTQMVSREADELYN